MNNERAKGILNKILSGKATQKESTEFYVYLRVVAKGLASTLYFRKHDEYDAIKSAVDEVEIELTEKHNVKNAVNPLAYIKGILYNTLIDLRKAKDKEPGIISYSKFVESIADSEQLDFDDLESLDMQRDNKNKTKLWHEYTLKRNAADLDFRSWEAQQKQAKSIKPKKRYTKPRALKVPLSEITPKSEHRIMELYDKDMPPAEIKRELKISRQRVSHVVLKWTVG